MDFVLKMRVLDENLGRANYKSGFQWEIVRFHSKFTISLYSVWAPAGGGEASPPPETEKIVVEKW